MAWFSLTIAGIFEVIWAHSLKSLSQSFGSVPLVICCVSISLSLAMLSLAMKSLPLSLAYPIWTGIGSVGTTLVGVVFHKESLSHMHVLGIGLVLAGILLISVARS